MAVRLICFLFSLCERKKTNYLDVHHDITRMKLIHSFIHFFIANKCQNAFAVT